MPSRRPCYRLPLKGGIDVGREVVDMRYSLPLGGRLGLVQDAPGNEERPTST